MKPQLRIPNQISDQLIERLTVINQFLEPVLDDPLRLSDILTQTGFSTQDVDSIRKLHLEQFVNAVCDRLVAYLNEALPPKQARVVSERYCLSRQDKPTLQEVANEFGRSRERIRQLQNVGMRKLRRWNPRAVIEEAVFTSATAALHPTDAERNRTPVGI